MVVFIAYFALLASPFFLSQHARSRSSGNRDPAAYSGQSISSGAISARSSAGGVPLQDCARRLRSRCQDQSANRKCTRRLEASRTHVAEYRQRDLLFRSSESKTISFNKDGLANVLYFGGQRFRPWQYTWKRNE